MPTLPVCVRDPGSHDLPLPTTLLREESLPSLNRGLAEGADGQGSCWRTGAAAGSGLLARQRLRPAQGSPAVERASGWWWVFYPVLFPLGR